MIINGEKKKNIIEALGDSLKDILMFNHFGLICRHNEWLVRKGYPPWVVDSKIEQLSRYSFKFYVKIRKTNSQWKYIGMTEENKNIPDDYDF
jgi:hypothetical protein